MHMYMDMYMHMYMYYQHSAIRGGRTLHATIPKRGETKPNGSVGHAGIAGPGSAQPCILPRLADVQW